MRTRIFTGHGEYDADGNEHGKWLWRRRRKKWILTRYFHGVLHGPWVEWDEQGQKRKLARFVFGVPLGHGLHRYPDPRGLKPPRTWLRLLWVGGLLFAMVLCFQQPSLVAALLVLGLTILLHELGHLLAAKLMGIPIEVFRIGLGPCLFQFNWSSTRYEFAPLLVWGYVRAYNLRPTELLHYRGTRRAHCRGEPLPKTPRIRLSEEQKPAWQLVWRPRQLVFLLGGVVTNFFVFFWATFAEVRFAPHDTSETSKAIIDRFFQSGESELAVLSGATTESFWALLIAFSVLNLLLCLGNLLPIPPLDGYRILRVLVEMFLRRDLPVWLALPIEILGFLLLVIMLGVGVYMMLRDAIRIGFG